MLWSGALAYAQPLNRVDLTRRTLIIDVSNSSVEDVLIVLATEHRVPIGFERSALYQKQITVQLVRVSLKTVLDSIIAQAPVYRWELKDGVINFVPRIGRDPFLQTLLSTRVTRYRPLKGTNKFELRNTLADLLEVKSLLKRNHVTVPRLSDYAYFPSIYSKPDVDLSVSHTDVRGVLNKIARESEHNIWFVQWRNEQRRELMLGF